MSRARVPRHRAATAADAAGGISWLGAYGPPRAVGRGNRRERLHAGEGAQWAPRHLIDEVVELPRRLAQVRDGGAQVTAILGRQGVRIARQAVEPEQQPVRARDRE